MADDGFEDERARFALEIDLDALAEAGGWVNRNEAGEIVSAFVPGPSAAPEDLGSFPEGWTQLGYTTEG